MNVNNAVFHRPHRVLWFRYLLSLVAILSVLYGCSPRGAGLGVSPIESPVATPTSEPSPTAAPPEPVTISMQDLEETYGIQIGLVAVTAAGGMIDFRFRVLDEDKAAQLLGKPKPRLAIVAEASGTVIETPPDVVQHFTLEDNQIYFVTFPNPQHAVSSGGLVSLEIDRVRVAHVPVQ